MNLKDYYSATHWYIDPIYGNDTNDGKAWATPLKTITKTLELIQGLVVIDWVDGTGTSIPQPSWIMGDAEVQRMPAIGTSTFGFKIKWRKPGDGYIYLSLACDISGVSGGMPFCFLESPGPELKLPESFYGFAWLYDGLISDKPHRELPTYGIRLYLDFSGWYEVGTSGEKLFTTKTSVAFCSFDFRARNVVHILGGIVTENIPVIRSNVEFDGTGISFGNVLLYIIFGLMHSETTLLPPIDSADADCLLPTLTVFGGVTSFDGCNIGLVVVLGDSQKLVNAVSAGDARIEIDSWANIGVSSLVGGILKIGNSSAPSELFRTKDTTYFQKEMDVLNWDSGDGPELRESVPGGGYNIIVLNTDYGAVYDKWVGIYGLATGKMTFSLAITGFDYTYTTLEKINEGGTDKSKFTLSSPVDPAVIGFFNTIGALAGTVPIGGYNHIVPLLRPLVASWPVGTPVDIWQPAGIGDLWGVKYEFNECAICSSTAGVVSPAFMGMSSVLNIMTGLWEMDWTGRNIFFLNGVGTPAFLNYSFLPKRKKFDKTYFIMMSDCHVFDFPPFDLLLPWYTTPMHFVWPMLDQLSTVANSTILWMNSGSTDNLIRQRSGQMYDTWFGQNAYIKTLGGGVQQWMKDFILGIADPTTMKYELFEMPQTYPPNTTNKDDKPMYQPDEYISSTITARIPAPAPVIAYYDIDNQFYKCTSIPAPNPRNLYVGSVDYILENWYQLGHLGDPGFLYRRIKNNFYYDSNRNLINVKSEDV